MAIIFKTKFAALLLSILVTSCSQAPSNFQLVREYEEYKNNGDLDSALAMFAEDASLHFGPMGSLSGKDKIRNIHEYDIAIRTKLKLEECHDVDRDLACRTTESNEWLMLAGIETIIYDESLFHFTPDGLIQSVSTTLSPESNEALGSAMMQFDSWAKSNRPDEYSSLFSHDGAFVYSYQNGERVLVLLRQWRAN